jgi:predicted nucleotidyltransferase
MLNKNFREFLKLLIENDVEFLVVGGYAVGVHGFPRYTGDMDVFVALNPDNALRIAAAFDAFGFGSLGISAADFQQEDSIVEIGREPNKIQVLTGIDGVRFDAAYRNRVEVELDGLRIPFIGIDDLLRNKEASGRGKDLIDLEELRRIKSSKPSES